MKYDTPGHTIVPKRVRANAHYPSGSRKHRGAGLGFLYNEWGYYNACVMLLGFAHTIVAFVFVSHRSVTILMFM